METFCLFFNPQGKPASLKTAQPSRVNLPRLLPRPKASVKNPALRRTESASSVASVHSELSAYSNNCKSVLRQTLEPVETVVVREI